VFHYFRVASGLVSQFLLLQAKPVARDRFISKMFLRGDSVILVLKNPLGTAT
jgi:hypothetical protein